MTDPIFDYFDEFGRLMRRAVATDASGAMIATPAAIDWAIRAVNDATAAGNKIMLIGNGGSAAVASHMANDFSKNGGLRALALNDASVLTCLSNDYGYEHVFAKQIEWHARAGDVLIAISSSGKSPNILKGVEAARERGCRVLGLSGFGADNPLRGMADMNIHVPSDFYGFVEITHLAICHCILDCSMGLVRRGRSAAASVA